MSNTVDDSKNGLLYAFVEYPASVLLSEQQQQGGIDGRERSATHLSSLPCTSSQAALYTTQVSQVTTA